MTGLIFFGGGTNTLGGVVLDLITSSVGGTVVGVA